MRWLQGGYERVLSPDRRDGRAGRTPPSALTVSAGVAVVPFLGQSLLPNFKERDFLMHWLTQPDTSGPEEVARLRSRLQGAADHSRASGTADRTSGTRSWATSRTAIYFGENWISVDPKVDYDETLASVQEVVDGYPGIYRDVQTYLRERIKEVLTGSSDAIVVRIYGDDLHVLEEKADEVLEVMEGVEGALRAEDGAPRRTSRRSRSRWTSRRRSATG